MGNPLCIDLFCGLGGWAEGFIAEGWQVIGFDIERHRYPARAFPESHAKARGGIDFSRGDSFNGTTEKLLRAAPLTGRWDEYPGQLVLQDVLTLHGSQFRSAGCIVASPPCQAYSYRAMPWKRAKALPPPSNELFDACFRIQREACEAAGRHIPLVVENVKGAQPWVGRAKWHYGSFYLWGDVPALMPSSKVMKNGTGESWFGINGSYARVKPNDARDRLVKAGIKAKDSEGYERTHPDAFGWKAPQTSSKSLSARKAASAQIAKIPFALSQWIAQVYKP